jgi:hypothetical protein
MVMLGCFLTPFTSERTSSGALMSLYSVLLPAELVVESKIRRFLLFAFSGN